MFPRRLFVFLFFLAGFAAEASHIRGGYIFARRISGYRYEFLLTIYRDTASAIRDNRNFLYPDASLSVALSGDLITPTQFITGKGTEICTYRYEYTYSSPGVYTAYHYQLFRNDNVLNMSLSASTTFYVETKVIIDPFLPPDQSPVVYKAAVDFASVGSVFRYNPAAADPDGDSLSYQLVPSRQFIQSQGISAPVTNYSDPAVRSGGTDSAGSGPATLVLNPVTGDLVWNVPRLAGHFNTAIKIIQWRKTRPGRSRRDSIGYVLLDIQILVRDIRNRRPLLEFPRDTCVVAGAVLNARIFARDPDPGDVVTIKLSGELNNLIPASRRARFQNLPAQNPPFSGDFEWQTSCLDVRSQPYQAIFEAEDRPANQAPPLVDIRAWRIKVVGPPPEPVSLEPDGARGLRIRWKKYVCNNAARIVIYRKAGTGSLTRDTCRPGMPPGSGFVRIADVPPSDSSFVDNNGGAGLIKGPTYCYRLVAQFPEPAGGESLVSDEICRPLRIDIPVLLNVDVLRTGTDNGQTGIRWNRPRQLDSTAFPPPYRTELFRRAPGGGSPVPVYQTTSLTDTFTTDNGLNTRDLTYSWFIRFRYGPLALAADSTPAASSVRLEAIPGIREINLSWTASVPWINENREHRVFRSENGGPFVQIDAVTQAGPVFRYSDRGTFQNRPLSDTSLYCYRVQTSGTYSNPELPEPLLNFSQEICAKPTDTVKPCAPAVLAIREPANFSCSNCRDQETVREFSRTLTWPQVQRDTCGRDLSRYRVYFSAYEEDPPQLLTTTTDTFFVHSSLADLAGCYAVTSLDRSGNESALINRTCTDNCLVFDLPSLITPGTGDGLNDIFRPACFSRAFIQRVEFSVFNRWGKQVFSETTGPEIGWGSIPETGQDPIVSGVYFYLARVKARRLRRADEDMIFRGWIQVFK